MADRYTSKLALVLDEAVHVGEVVRAAVEAGDVDRASALRGDDAGAQEVHWGGRMQKGVVRRLGGPDGEVLLRAEAYIGDEGLVAGMQRHATLLQALARQVRGHVEGVRDLSAHAERDEAWMNRLAVGAAGAPDAIVVHRAGEGTHWVYTHGAARFDVPDLELYGLARAQLDAAEEALRHAHDGLLRRGLRADLELPGGTDVYLVPVLEAWQELPHDWPGVASAGQDRGPDLDGPRATLSVRHKPRFGRYRTDLKGVVEALPAA